MNRYDIAIIGTGPAGLSAAVTAKIRNKNILLFGEKELSTKVNKAQFIHNYLGMPQVSGADLSTAYSNHLEAMDILVTEERVAAVYAMGEYFSIQAGINQYEARSLIVASGLAPAKTYPGENEYLGRGVSYCATCDAPLYKGKKVAIVGFSKKEEMEAAFMAEVAQEVLYFPMYQEEVSVPETITVIYEKPVRVEGDTKAERLVTQENTYEVDGIFFLRESVFPAQLVPGIRMDGNHIEVNRKMETNIRGCFACGDIVGAPYQYIKAAGEGNVAALSAVAYLDGQK